MNQDEINRRVEETLAEPMPPMQAVMLPMDGSGEEYISLCRGFKANFDGAEHFWLKARQKREWWDLWENGEGFGEKYENYADYAASLVKSEEPLVYTPLSKEEFYEFVNLFPCFGARRQPLSEILELDELESSYVSGVYAEAEDKWSSRMAFAEFADEFVAFHWQTTA